MAEKLINIKNLENWIAQIRKYETRIRSFIILITPSLRKITDSNVGKYLLSQISHNYLSLAV